VYLLASENNRTYFSQIVETTIRIPPNSANPLFSKALIIILQLFDIIFRSSNGDMAQTQETVVTGSAVSLVDHHPSR